MFGWRSRASRLHLFYGQNVATKNLLNRLNAREQTSIASRSAHAFFGGGIGRFRSRWIKLLNHHHPLHTSAQDDFSELDEPKNESRGGAEGFQLESCRSLDDGDWSELGPVKKKSDTVPKLLTEKPEHFREVKGKRKALPLSSSTATKATNVKGSTSKPKKSSPTTGQKAKAKSNGSRTKSGKNDESSTKNSNSGTVPDAPPSVVSIRISNLNLETADSAIHSTCSSFGSLEGLVRFEEDTVEALFRVRDSKEVDRILKKLKDTTVDDFQWSAELQCKNPTSTDFETSQDQIGTRISDCVFDLKRQTRMRLVLTEDLEALLQSVLHLENNPLSRKG